MSDDKKAKSGGDNRRILRVEREIREVISAYLLGGFRGELPGFVTVSRVIVSRDLRNAKVFVGVLGTEEEREVSLESLTAHAFEVQSEINRQLRMKFCPRVHFRLDESMEKHLKVERILHELAQKREQERVLAERGQEQARVERAGVSFPVTFPTNSLS